MAQGKEKRYILKFWALFGVLSISGCFLGSQVSEERYLQAVKLVDQGAAHLRMGKLEEAFKSFSLAEEFAPLAAAVDGQGCVALLKGNFLQAESLFVRAYEMDSSYDEALANLALLMDVSGRKVKAKELYNQSVIAIPTHVAARNNRAALEYDQGGGRMGILAELEKAGLVAEHHVISENVKRLKRAQQ
jgi:Flp pilus assembly protein TadD